MSTEWDSEFQRLNRGEVPHPATADLLYWQVSALLEDEPQKVEAWYKFEAVAGSIHLNRQFGVDDPSKITQTIEIYAAPNESQTDCSVFKLEYTPQSTFVYRYNTEVKDPIATTLGIIDAIKEKTNLTGQELGMLDSLGALAEAIVLMDEEDLPDELIIELGSYVAETINRRADMHIVSSELSILSDAKELRAKLRRYVDMSSESPEFSENQGEFELLLTDKKAKTVKVVAGRADQEVYVMDPFDIETGLGDYRPATATDEHDTAKMLAALLHPSLPNRSPEWLSQYSDYLGWSIHQEGPESAYGVVMGVELNHIREIFVKQFEGKNHFMPKYPKDRRIEDIEFFIADAGYHPNGCAITAEEIVNFQEASVQQLDTTTSCTAIYMGTTFLQPGIELEGIQASYGAYVDVVLAVGSEPEQGKISRRVGSVALNANTQIESVSTFN